MCDLFGFFLVVILILFMCFMFIVLFMIIKHDIKQIKIGGNRHRPPIRLDKVKKKKRKDKNYVDFEFDDPIIRGKNK